MMKKFFAVAFLLSPWLCGCGSLNSDAAWRRAERLAPLQLPQGLDRPGASQALAIPRVNDSLTPQVSQKLHVAAAVDAAYQQVGDALRGSANVAVTSSDAARRVYQTRVGRGVEQWKKHGALTHLFGHHRVSQDEFLPPSIVAMAMLSVHADGADGSSVEVRGDSDAVATLMGILKAKFGH